jgi:hypothetical protein
MRAVPARRREKLSGPARKGRVKLRALPAREGASGALPAMGRPNVRENSIRGVLGWPKGRWVSRADNSASSCGAGWPMK